MIRNPQILGSRARQWRLSVLVTLSITLSLGACGLKGPLYMPAPAAQTVTAGASSPAAPAAKASAPSTQNTPAR